jgi:predicted metal-dependent peptidase
VGGGGTDFAPIVSHIAKYREQNAATPATSILPIILTDGYAQLNLDYDTANPLLWVVSPGGIRSEDFPYGDVARIEGP